MSSSVDALKFRPNAAAAAAVVVAVLAGFAELNTGMDKNSALMLWFFFTLCAGFLLQFARTSYRGLFWLALQPAGAFVITQLAGAYFYGITEFSAMHYSWSVESILKLVAVAAVTAAMTAVVAQAGPLFRVGLQRLGGFTAERAAAVAATIGGLGAIITAVVVLYKLIVFHQGNAP